MILAIIIEDHIYHVYATCGHVWRDSGKLRLL
jgi:hypothetical protein